MLSAMCRRQIESIEVAETTTGGGETPVLGVGDDEIGIVFQKQIRHVVQMNEPLQRG